MNEFSSKIAGFLFLLILSCSTNLLQAQDGPAYRSESFTVSGQLELSVSTSGGAILVEGHDADQVLVEMYVRRNGKTYKAGDADLDDYEITIEQNGNSVLAEAKRKNSMRSWNNGYSISFIVKAPSQTKSDLRTSGGSVSVSDLDGDQELRTSGGMISAMNIQGNVEMRTSGGQVEIVRVTGDVNARTSGGTIRAELIRGALEVRTSGGAIALSAIYGNVEARTSGGTITAEISEPNEIINLRTSGGSINITVPGGKGYDLDLDGGRVNANLVDFDGRAERDEVVGRVGNGGTKINARTSSGSVNLKFY